MTDELLTELQGRIKRFVDTGDKDAILSPETHELAASLQNSLPDEPADLEVLYILGWWSWYAYLLLPEGKNEAARHCAVKFFQPVYRVSPGAVPEQVRRFLA